MPDPAMWDERFSEPAYAYGTEPNDFLREVAPRIPRGRVLCLAEGQGRNAVYLASLGHDVTAMDLSAVGLARARELAAAKGVRIATVQADLADFVIEPGAWQGIVAIFMHLPPDLRARVLRAAATGLAPGGAFVQETYGPAQPRYGTGGPREPDRLASLAEMQALLPGLEFAVAREVERDVVEGPHHTGRSATVQLLGIRPGR